MDCVVYGPCVVLTACRVDCVSVRSVCCVDCLSRGLCRKRAYLIYNLVHYITVYIPADCDTVLQGNN